MPALSRTSVERALAQKGFDRTEGGKHRVYRLLVDGLETGVATVVSRGAQKTLGNPLVGAIARELHLTGPEFRQLVDCPLSHDDYVGILRGKGILI